MKATGHNKSGAKAMPGANGGGVQKLPKALPKGTPQVVASRGFNQMAAMLESNPKFKSTYEWAARASHPCDERRTGAVPIPDKTSRTTACPEYRYDTTFSAPATYCLDGTTMIATTKWDCALHSPDMVEVGFLKFMKPTDVEWGVWNAALRDHKDKNVGWEYTANRFDQYPEGTSIADVAEAWRVTHRGMTVHLDAPEINNTGMIYAQHWPEEWEVLSNEQPIEGGHEFERVVAKVGPWTPKDQTQRAGNTYEINAFTGTYVIQYPDQQFDVVAYQSQGTFQGQVNDKPSNNGFDNSNANGGVWYSPPGLIGFSSDVHHGFGIQTHGYKGGWTAGLAYFEGLPGAGGSGIAPSANLVVKIRQGVECVPRPNSPLAPFTVGPVPYNPGAIEFVVHVAQSAAMAYPADYNDFGKIWGAIKRGLKDYGMPITDAVANSGIPVISDVAKIGKGIASFFGA